MHRPQPDVFQETEINRLEMRDAAPKKSLSLQAQGLQSVSMVVEAIAYELAGDVPPPFAADLILLASRLDGAANRLRVLSQVRHDE